ncbi:protein of unknown function [Candidatus Nitrospira inopinata]|uniref:Uncharacterized protein n=1 Tax=Candidatus Nitrospira inopinata TaxID=1715989 RepID=A0A0S4KSI3_9BACT|nr:protein of unknown function [Candidatus Nitrospira inopinata]
MSNLFSIFESSRRDSRSSEVKLVSGRLKEAYFCIFVKVEG